MTGYTAEIGRKALALREEGLSWAAIGRQLGCAPNTIRYNVDPAFRQSQRDASKRYRDKDSQHRNKDEGRKGSRLPRRSAGSKPGSPTPPQNDEERRERADGLMNTSLAEDIERRVAARVGPMKRVKR